jgi:hypothetical protein
MPGNTEPSSGLAAACATALRTPAVPVEKPKP